jgi:uncharacterized membrane protein YfcA
MAVKWIILLLAAFWAGAQNALAGGGSFITLPALMLSGLDARAANITSTVALFPGQTTTGLVGRKLISGTGLLSFRALLAISLAGGAVGAVLLLATPASFFARLLPWLVLFATAVFAWGSFILKPAEKTQARHGALAAGAVQFCIAIYGGYFGGGIGFLMLAALTIAGLGVRAAGATKNMLASVINASAVVIFIATSHLDWLRVAAVAAGAVGGGVVGSWMLRRVNETALRIVVVVIGLSLTVALFLGAV